MTAFGDPPRAEPPNRGRAKPAHKPLTPLPERLSGKARARMSATPPSPPVLKVGWLQGEVSSGDFTGVAVAVSGRFKPQPGQYLHIAFIPRPAPTLIHRWSEVRPFRHLHESLQGPVAMLPACLAVAGYNYDPRNNETVYELALDPTAVFDAELLASPPGRPLSIMGPLGTAFRVLKARPGVVLVASGGGIGPMMFLNQVLTDANRPEPALFYKPTHGDPAALANRLASHLTDHEADLETIVVMAAGEDALLAHVGAVAARLGLPCQVMLSRPMPCSTGACQGCVVPCQGGYQLCCQQGPVFDATVIDWHALGCP